MNQKRLDSKELDEIDHKTRAVYMVMWISRRAGHPAYSSHLLEPILRQHTDEILADLLEKGHIIPALSGFYLTDAGVTKWAHLATECATVNNFDPQLKIWANWIMRVDELLMVLRPGEWVHPERHINYPVLRESERSGWIEVNGNVQRLRTYKLTEAGLQYRESLHAFA